MVSSMGESAVHTGHFKAPPLTHRALGFVVLAAVLIGVGLLMLMEWIFTLTTDWYWFLGVVPATVGSILLFLPVSGPEHA
jgi:hypothetical protein